jgi:hypothetical protein
MRKIYTTFQGKSVDMDQLLQKNETMPAVGNVRVNARGDELGPDGSIIRSRESVLSEYYDSNPTSVIDDDISLNKVKIQNRKPAATEAAPAVEAPIKVKSKDTK